MNQEKVAVDVEGRTLTLSNLPKVLYPEAGFTKAEVIDYYRQIAPVLVPHLENRPLTLKRYPNGVASMFFFEKNAGRSTPEWVKTVGIWGNGRGEDLQFILCNDAATLVYLANLAACCKAAVVLREYFDRAGLISFAKTSGNKGLQLYVPLNTPTTYDDTKAWARGVAEHFEARFPEFFISQMKKSLRAGKIFVDWSQNDANKTTISVYSLRARERPTVSTPVSWEEIEEVARSGDARPLIFEAEQVVQRVKRDGDLFAPTLTLEQQLPDFPRAETKKRGRSGFR